MLSPDDLRALSEFFSRWAKLLTPVLVPGANVVVAANPLLSHIVAGALAELGLERRGEIVRLVMTMRGGDRPKGALDEFSEVSVMPRSMWEPWLVVSQAAGGTGAGQPAQVAHRGIQATLSPTSFRGRHPLVPDPEGGAGSGAASEPEAAGIPPAIGQGGAAARRGHRSRSVLRRGVDACRGGKRWGYRSVGIENDSEYFDMACQGIPRLRSYRREQADMFQTP